MKLYLSPGACSLASHIALHEAGMTFDRVTVDLRAKRTDDGRDYMQINPKGYVPALAFDDGELLTENVAVLDWIATKAPALGVSTEAWGAMARSRLLEMLAFISTEIHKQFGRIFVPSGDAEREQAVKKIGKRFDYLAERMTDDYLFGSEVTVADAYLYVMLFWAGSKGVAVPPGLQAFKARMDARPAVRQALAHEQLDQKAG